MDKLNPLVAEFLAEEGAPFIRRTLAEAIALHPQRPGECTRLFEFNRFDVTLDFGSSTVLVEDIIATQPGAEARMPLQDFRRVLMASG